MAEVVQIAKPGMAGPAPGGFVMTEMAQDILRSLCLVHEGDGAQFTMIAGAPGIGKTRALEQFIACEGKVELIAFKRGEGKPTGVAETLYHKFMHWEKFNGRSLTYHSDVLCPQVRRSARTILADEAQHLTPDGIEWLRGFAEEAGVSVAFIGDLGLESLIQPIPQLRSRLLRPIVARKASAKDVQAVAGAFFVEDPKALRALEATAELDGRLRNVANVLNSAKGFAGGGSITTTHILAAISDLRLNERRAKQ